MEILTELLKPERRKPEEISALTLIIFLGMSVSWLAFDKSKLIYMRKGRKREYCFLLHTSHILSMLGWLRYFTMELITESLMLSEIRLQLAYSAILKLLTILEKKVFRICGVLMSLSMILSASINVSFSLDTILSDKNGLMVLQ